MVLYNNQDQCVLVATCIPCNLEPHPDSMVIDDEASPSDNISPIPASLSVIPAAIIAEPPALDLLNSVGALTLSQELALAFQQPNEPVKVVKSAGKTRKKQKLLPANEFIEEPIGTSAWDFCIRACKPLHPTRTVKEFKEYYGSLTNQDLAPLHLTSLLSKLRTRPRDRYQAQGQESDQEYFGIAQLLYAAIAEYVKFKAV
ncbi:hypothetical protein C8J56DRAFT_1113922 [Mycena floridula]|nr:hypothetical protein C8J56DRAFT_1113922 [Mycena floridula]